MARELTHAIKLYFILGSFETINHEILLGIDSVTPYTVGIYLFTPLVID